MGQEDCVAGLRAELRAEIARGNCAVAAHLGEDPRLELPHLRVLAAAAEEAGRLDAEVAQLFPSAVHKGGHEGLLLLVFLGLEALLFGSG